MHFDLRKTWVQFSGALPIASVTLDKLQELSKVPFPPLCKANNSISFKNECEYSTNTLKTQG